MKRLGLIMCLVILLLAILAVRVPHATAQSGGTYDLTWNTIDGGGGMSSTGGAYELYGTIGQMDAGNPSGDPFALSGGFWHDFVPPLFLPIIFCDSSCPPPS